MREGYNMKNNAVIFDLDGTMWNACGPVMISWNAVLKRHDLPQITRKFKNFVKNFDYLL